MGCDIHAYVEWANPVHGDRPPYWRTFTRNSGSRDYLLFGILAGVRAPHVQMFEPKGMPEGPLGSDTADDYWRHVAPDAHPEWADGDDWVSKERAEQWIERGLSVGERREDGSLSRVSDPDWHSHSWLTADELSQALDRYAELAPEYSPGGDASPSAEWPAMLAAMQCFEGLGRQARVVFWFDN